MQITFTGHHIDVTPALREFATKKFDKLLSHFDRIVSINVTFAVEKLLNIAEASIHIPGHELHASSKSEDMYAAIDLLTDKLFRLLKKHKEKDGSHR